jgi:lambda family phage tail tape measure protein
MQTKLDSFSKKMSDFGGMVADVVTKAFTGLEDQLVSFATTGKMEFKKLAQSIIADITRIAIRASITKPLMGMFGFNFDKNATGGVFSNGTKLTRYAKGGVVDRPTMFAMGGQGNFGLMSESGPEAIMPLKRGKGGRLGVEGGGGTSVVVNVDASGGTEVSGSEEQARMLGQAVAAAVRTQIANERRPGGLLYA